MKSVTDLRQDTNRIGRAYARACLVCSFSTYPIDHGLALAVPQAVLGRRERRQRPRWPGIFEGKIVEVVHWPFLIPYSSRFRVFCSLIMSSLILLSLPLCVPTSLRHLPSVVGWAAGLILDQSPP